MEDVGELIREKQLENSLQRQPARVPVRPQGQHPLAGGRAYRRHFSTCRNPLFTAKNINLNFSAWSNCTNWTSFKPSAAGRFQTILSQTQPLRASARARLGHVGRGGFGAGMFSYFPKQRARMFSTLGPNLTHQAVENLSQGLRMFFLKGGKLSHDCWSNSTMTNGWLHLTNDDRFADHDMNLAGKVSEISSQRESGCIIEFDLSCPSVVATIPESGFFDDESSLHLELLVESNLKMQKKILKDIQLFRENIGSTSYRFQKKRERLRFYCPNCDVYKMEQLLQECGISTGIVMPNEEQQELNSCGQTLSVDDFSGPELESDSSVIDSYSDSDSDSILSSQDDDDIHADYYHVSGSGDHSILSTSDEFFDVEIVSESVLV